MSPPEFTITCRTQGGPATQFNASTPHNENHTKSQIILNTSHSAVYDNRLHMRGRVGGRYTCIIRNELRTRENTTEHSQVVRGEILVKG